MSGWNRIRLPDRGGLERLWQVKDLPAGCFELVANGELFLGDIKDWGDQVNGFEVDVYGSWASGLVR